LLGSGGGFGFFSRGTPTPLVKDDAEASTRPQRHRRLRRQRLARDERRCRRISR